jgi:hypothetical protein
MRVRILVQITADDGAAGAAEEIGAFEKRTERPEDLGLSIANPSRNADCSTCSRARACRPIRTSPS